jgi:hypothetical protein
MISHLQKCCAAAEGKQTGFGNVKSGIAVAAAAQLEEVQDRFRKR